MTCVPLYVPQFKQVWCGGFGSWHCGHTDRLGAADFFRRQLARRMSRRDLECRCFGFGMVVPHLAFVVRFDGSGVVSRNFLKTLNGD